MVLSAAPLNQSRATTLLLDQMIDELAQEQNLTRIKKLLLYVCTGTWETDPRRLEQASLRVLIQHLFEISLTFEALQQQLNQAVASLNKAAEYRIVANAIISRLSAVYALHNALPQEAMAEVTLAFYGPIYWEIAQQLQQSPAHARIKKLLVLTCRSTWENNPLKLEQISLTDLVRELHQIAPSPDSLGLTLHQVAKALSKPEEYAQVADMIRVTFQVLYQAEVYLPASAVSDSARKTIPASDATELRTELRVEGIELAPLKALTIALTSKALTRQQSAISTVPVVSRASVPVANLASAKPALRVVRKQPRAADLFDLRLEIMHDTNPLKAKILLFSLLHTLFQDDVEHEALLKTHELDDLFRILFLSFRSYAELEDKLRQTAKRLAGNEYPQSAEAILRALRPFYGVNSAPMSSDLPMQTADITDIKADTQEITQPD
jgi:hypothetical protein